MKFMFFEIIAFVTVSKLWTSAENKWASWMSRIKTEPRVRANHSRKGRPMRTQISTSNLETEAVWSVEALDPLQQRAWAQALWQAAAHKPLLLYYKPCAERAALRALNAFARLSRSAETPPGVVLAEPRLNAMLAPAPSRVLSLCLLHRASRFVNLAEWLAQAPAACRIVLTMPEAEAKISRAARSCEPVEIPTEEESYCGAVAQEILQKHFGASTTLSQLEEIVTEAGIAELALPVCLLASSAVRAKRLARNFAARALAGVYFLVG